MIYRKCSDCGAHLDHGARCDCKDEKEAVLADPDKPKGEEIRL